MSQDNNHDEWLSLIEISGPFLAVPVLKKAFPQGLEVADGRVRKYLRQAYDEWCEARDNDDPLLEELHRAWIREVLARGLEYDENDSGELLKRGEAIPATLHIALPEHSVTLSPDYALVNGQKALLLIQTYPADTDLDAAISQQGWVAAPTERMVQLCRTTGCRLGLVTNGERWLLIDAPVGSVVTYASWYARLWGQEPLTLQAFLTLLGIRRFFVDASEQLPALFDESQQHQEEVTDALGEQVRRAVEVLIQSLDKEDLNSARTLLQDVAPTQLYEAGLTIMMRLVFLLSAEERGLLLMGDEAYEANYAISTLRMQLRKESDEVLERRHDAWARLLATFRAVYGGIEHETLRLPALGGSLFDPDRFPFLEGRPAGSNWRIDDARPLPIDNRTVLLLLEAIQQYQGRTLSYRALDVEQIGYVYEGLLERTVKRTDAVTVELVGGKGAKKTIHALSELEALRGHDEDEFTRHLASADALKRSESAIHKDLSRVVDAALTNFLLTACHGDEVLRERLLPIANLLRTDPWGYPLVYAKGAFIVTTGSDRRETGTHYTPKSLTEAIVAETLTPVAYIGPAEGTPREQWALKSPSELLDLKICDPAMGSGAFLVQACRWLSDRLVESWSQVEASGKTVNVDGEVLEAGAPDEPLPRDSEARTVIARRLIAERCLYGVDLNPLAVELAKLSIWLVTLAKGRPFGFLDHNLRCGDSLLGIHRLDQLTDLTMTPGAKGQQRLFGKNIERAVNEAIELRQRLREMPIRDIHDVEAMARLDADARLRLDVSGRVADALVGEVLATGDGAASLERGLASLSIQAGQAFNNEKSALEALEVRSKMTLTVDLPTGKSTRIPFHWPLEFPEVFVRQRLGFDAFVGNPPFIGNRLWKGTLGDRLQWQCQMILGSPPGKIDLCVVFHRRAVDLIRQEGCYGLLATSNIAEGSAITVGLGVVAQQGEIYFARKAMPWPGAAAVDIAIVCFRKGSWNGVRNADGADCPRIGSRLEPEFGDVWEPKELPNEIFSFEGVNNSKGLAFVITDESPWFERLRSETNSLLRPYITGDDITSSALTRLERWALDIADRDLDEIRATWPEAYRFLIEEGLPTRTIAALKSYKGLIDRWWQFWNHRAELMRRLRRQETFVAFSKVTKYPICMPAPSDWIYTNKVLLIEESRPDFYAICLSSLFRRWVEVFSGGKLEGRLQISITESVNKYPLPAFEVSDEGKYAAAAFKNLAVQYSSDNGCGLTDVMNAVHTPTNADATVAELRNLLVTVDAQVAAAYGWTDIETAYDFRDFAGGSVNDPWRWALSEDVTAELMRRLTELNRHCFEELSLAQATASSPAKRGRRPKVAAPMSVNDLFAGSNE
ncbi:Eco57I restriction-modification methylase domain-containing protein [Pseudomonas extremaustralis]|uniref:Eco57I restriction-modification methylase domain-containing protein n=1 Tax=Pseudomonas extremaustralis TaxID=359110 RepID=UPI00230821A6|nr:type IIL restriction-modification enzyme MmeI [Pseudomonas extremaustralis]MDB1112810.1 hypothetical protein [Pseudomonas extremaustralis]